MVTYSILQAQTQLREVTETRDQLALQLQQNTTILEETRGTYVCNST